MRRWGLPIVAVLLLVAIVLVSRQLGYIGRADGGPLTQPSGFTVIDAAARRTRVSAITAPYAVDGGTVRITRARPVLASPGLRVLGPRLTRLAAGESRRLRRWPPPRGDRGPFAGSRLRGRGVVVFGLRARRPGAYYLWRFATEYDRGARRFRRLTRAAAPACIAIRSACNPRAGLPRGDVELADIGGPSDYGVRPRRDDRAKGIPVATFPGRPGARTVELTLTNLGRDPIDVRDLHVAAPRVEGFALRSTATPARFGLEPGAGRTVRLRLVASGCVEGGAGTRAAAIDALRARVDGTGASVPLLTRLAYSASDRC